MSTTVDDEGAVGSGELSVVDSNVAIEEIVFGVVEESDPGLVLGLVGHTELLGSEADASDDRVLLQVLNENLDMIVRP